MHFSIWKRQDPAPGMPEDGQETGKKKKGKIRENIEVILSAILIAVLIRVFLVDNYEIPSGSMIPTMLEGDRLFVTKFNYGVRLPVLHNWKLPRFDSPDRGDIVIFQYPNYRSPGWLAELADLFTFSIFGLDRMEKNFVKRAIGLPGDYVCLEEGGALWVNGKKVPQTFHEQRIVRTRLIDESRLKYAVQFVVGTNVVHEYTRQGGREEPESSYQLYREGEPGNEYIVQYLESSRGAWGRPFPPGPLASQLWYQEFADAWVSQNMLQSPVFDRGQFVGGNPQVTVPAVTMLEYQKAKAKPENVLIYNEKGEAWVRTKDVTNLQPLFAIYSNRLCAVVPKDHYFVMGDNRDNSKDSRFWGFLHKGYLMGSPLIRYLPFSRFGTID